MRGTEEASGEFFSPTLLRIEDWELLNSKFPLKTTLDLCPKGLPAV